VRGAANDRWLTCAHSCGLWTPLAQGCGRYADLIDYPSWVALNNAQRGHYNMVESSGPVLASMVVGGLALPKVVAILGLGYAAGRWLYAIGYSGPRGADGRVFGALLGGLSSLALHGTVIYLGIYAFFS